MTKAEKLMNSDPLCIELSVKRDDGLHEEYTAEFKPGYINPLVIRDKNKDADDPLGNAIYLSFESAVELAEFLKRLFLDKDPEK